MNKFIPLTQEKPNYYSVVSFKLKNGNIVNGWKASDGENEIYTIYNSDKIIPNKDIVGWSEMKIAVYHVLPRNDVKEHIETNNCPCNPKIEKQEDYGVIIIHNSFDRRELFE